MRSALLSLVVLLLLPRAATAHEPLAPGDEAAPQLWLATGLDGAVTARLGGALRLDALPLTLGAQLTLPPILLGEHAWEAQVFTRGTLLGGADGLGLQGRSALAWRATETVLDLSDGLVAEGALLGGWFGAPVLGALELSYESALLTRWRPTARYTHNFTEARPLLLAGEAGHWRAAAVGGVRFGAISLSLRAGVTTTQALNAALVPYFATLSVGWSPGT